MEQALSNWKALTPKKQAAAIAAALAVALAVYFLAQVASRPTMALLYSGLDPESAGEVIAALEAKGVKNEVRGEAIYVPKDRRDAIRFELAGNGLPKQGQAGFEILEKLNGFATTSDMFDAAYWRAEEGELARTILAAPGVKAARVHLAVPKNAPFARNGASASASVTVTMSRGVLTRAQAQSIRFIVALAVPGLSLENVAVIDSGAGVILAPSSGSATAEADAISNSRETALRESLVSLLEARVGPGNARVSVSVELNNDKEILTERIIDPKQRVVIESAATARNEKGTVGGVVTVASNLPEGDTANNAKPDASSSNETNETTRFDVSESRRERIVEPGAIKRIQVAVLLNELPQPAAEGDAPPPPAKRSEAELDALKRLVAAAIGFDAARGDVVSMESMAFEQSATEGSLEVKRSFMNYIEDNIFSLLQLIIPALVALILSLFVLKPILLTRQSNAEIAPPAPANAASPQPALADARAALPIELLQRVAAENAEASTNVLQSWFEEREATS